MTHKEIVSLIEGAVLREDDGAGIAWADLGSGEGAFTLGLRELLGPRAWIFSVDKNKRRLAVQKEAFDANFPGSPTEFIHADLAGDKWREGLPDLDGILMANTLHFFGNQEEFLATLRTLLKPHGRLVIVEYDTDRKSLFVPHPLTFETWQTLAERSGFGAAKLIARAKSKYWGSMYGALALR
ncbi:MAG TPA: class I SAM-dependent methyltransferase [Candidatus Paceibacterota bacterium]|nr:class I SAM-dependent methyltransferase [Candidatus Paceibacterota bacterium]